MDPFNRFVTAALLAVACLFVVDPALAQDAFDSLVSKSDELRDNGVRVVQGLIGVVAVVLFGLCAFNKANWAWFGMVIFAGAGVTAVDAWQSWFTN